MKFETAVKKIEAGLGDGGANAKQSISALFSEAIAPSEKKPVVEAAATLAPNTTLGTWQHQTGTISSELEFWANVGNRMLKRTEAQAALRLQIPPPTYKYNNSTENVIVFADGKNLRSVLTKMLNSNIETIEGSTTGGSNQNGNDANGPSVPILPKMRFTNYQIPINNKKNGTTYMVFTRLGNDGNIGFTPEIIENGQQSTRNPYHSFVMFLLKLLSISEGQDNKAWSVNELLREDYNTYVNYLTANKEALANGFVNALDRKSKINGTSINKTKIKGIIANIKACSNGQGLAEALAVCPTDYIDFGGASTSTSGTTNSVVGSRRGHQATHNSPMLIYPNDASANGYMLSSFFNMLANIKSGVPNFSIIDRVGFVPATDADDEYRKELYNQTNFSGLANSGWGKFGKALLSVRGADFNLMQA